MGFWSAVVLIVLIIAVASVMHAKHRVQNGITTDSMGNETRHPREDSAEKQMLRREVEELRERVKVLERIATDDRKKIGLADEIERLRDER